MDVETSAVGVGPDTPSAVAAGEPDAGPERRQLLIWLLAGVMALVAVGIAAPWFLRDLGSAVPDLRWLALLPLFAVAEVVVIHLPTQRSAHGHTLREIPAVLGLTFLAPQQYVTAYAVGAVLALVVAARMGGVKLAFNAAMFSLEAALGALTYQAILQDGDPLSWQGWLAVLVAVLVTDLMSAGAVTLAISLTEGAFDDEVLREALVSGSVAAFINTCVALLIATLVLVQPTALPLLGVIVALLVPGYRVYVSLARGHAQTRLLYRFVDRTSSARSTEELVGIVLQETAELMHAERAYLVELVDADHARCHHLCDGAVRVDALTAAQSGGAWWWSALEAGVVQHERPHGSAEVVPRDAALAVTMATPRDGLAARLRDTGDARYLLMVCDRSFEKETFGQEDVQVFEALAAHAGVALERTRTVGDLVEVAAELEAARDVALAASEAKSLFLANMSHEIRTPLAIMLASSEMLEDTDLDTLQRGLLERMQRSGGSLKTLVEHILDFSRIEAGQVELAAKPFDLHALVSDAAEVYGLRAERAGCGFASHVDEGVPRTVIGDSGRLFQVLDNLLDNALKFTSEGQVTLTARPAADSASHLELLVQDTGIGIAPEDQVSIFEVFSQVDPSTTRKYEGTGLGLAICKQLTELLGGTVSVQSEPGVGSTFTVRIPLLEAATSELAGDAQPVA